MVHTGNLENSQEARGQVLLAIASESNSYASFALSKLPMRTTDNLIVHAKT